MRTEPREILALGIFSQASLGDRIEMLLKRGREFSPRASLSRIIASALLLMLLAITSSLAPRWIAFAQQPSRTQFEVASVKRNISPGRNSSWHILPGGRFSGENINLEFLIMMAFHIRQSQISGAAGSLDSDKYDIVAKSEGNPNQDQLMKMLQGLLLDRFKIKYHWVTKQLSVYALVPAKSGIKLKKSEEGSCVDAGPETQSETTVVCGTYFSRGSQIEGKRITMAQFIESLEFQTDRLVIDKTGFSPAFDVHFEWTPEETAADRPTDLPGPSMFTAIQEQLGLKLELQKGPVEILVIDHVEKPDAN